MISCGSLLLLYVELRYRFRTDLLKQTECSCLQNNTTIAELISENALPTNSTEDDEQEIFMNAMDRRMKERKKLLKDGCERLSK